MKWICMCLLYLDDGMPVNNLPRRTTVTVPCEPSCLNPVLRGPWCSHNIGGYKVFQSMPRNATHTRGLLPGIAWKEHRILHRPYTFTRVHKWGGGNWRVIDSFKVCYTTKSLLYTVDCGMRLRSLSFFFLSFSLSVFFLPQHLSSRYVYVFSLGFLPIPFHLIPSLILFPITLFLPPLSFP